MKLKNHVTFVSLDDSLRSANKEIFSNSLRCVATLVNGSKTTTTLGVTTPQRRYSAHFFYQNCVRLALHLTCFVFSAKRYFRLN